MACPYSRYSAVSRSSVTDGSTPRQAQVANISPSWARGPRVAPRRGRGSRADGRRRQGRTSRSTGGWSGSERGPGVRPPFDLTSDNVDYDNLARGDGRPLGVRAGAP